MVILTGSCPSQKSKDDVENTIKAIKVIRGVVNHITISPVILNESFPLKQAIYSLLTAYPTVEAKVTKDGVLLYGKADKKIINRLMKSVYELHPPAVESRIVQEP